MTDIVPGLLRYLRTLRHEDGGRFVVEAWIKDFLAAAFAPRVFRAGLSCSRGLGKSTICGALAAAAVDPRSAFAVPGTSAVVVAASLRQGEAVFDACWQFLGRPAGGKGSSWKVARNQQRLAIENRENNCRVEVRGHAPAKLHGLRSARLVIVDEPAQHDPGSSELLWEAVSMCSGKVAGFKAIAIGTKSGSASSWFSKLIDTPIAPVEVSRCYSYSGTDHLSRAAIGEAYSMFGKRWPKHRQLLRRAVLADLKRALVDPEWARSFREYRLNVGGGYPTGRIPLVAPDEWQRMQIDAAPFPPNAVKFIGIDMSGGESFCAASCFTPEDSVVRGWEMCGDDPDVRRRGLMLGVGNDLQKMVDDGSLVVVPGKVPTVEAVLSEVVNRWGSENIFAVVADRYRMRELADGMRRCGLDDVPLWGRGMGWRDGDADIGAFYECMRVGGLRVVRGLALDAAAAGATVAVNVAGGRKFAKATEGGRRQKHKDDVIASSLLAVSAGWRWWQAEGQAEQADEGPLVFAV